MTRRPITLREARRFVGAHHRHNRPPHAWLFGIGVEENGVLVGVGIAARPARGLQDGYTVEIIRVCTTGARNACSMCYGALCRAAKALGYRRAFTYTLDDEDGASVKAAGFVLDAELPERGGWDCLSRPRVEVDLFGQQQTPTDATVRWVRSLAS